VKRQLVRIDSAARNGHSQNCNINGILGINGCRLLLLSFVIFVTINTAYHIQTKQQVKSTLTGGFSCLSTTP
jgi:hypothetical protein